MPSWIPHVFALVALLPAPAAAGDTASGGRWGELPCLDGWCYEYPDRPGLDGLEILGVHGTSPSRAWVVGGTSRGDRGFVARWDGTDWREAATTPDVLYGVWASGGDDAWAVGAKGSIVHWDGVGWSPAASPTREYLFRIGGSARDDVWAVGSRGTVLHHDGRGWSAIPSGTQAGISCLWAPRMGEAWFGGDGVLLRWDGTRLQAIPGAPQRIAGVGPLGDGAVAVVTREGRVVRWDGSRWSTLVDESAWRRALPSLSIGVRNVWFAPSGGAWGVGASDAWMLHLDGNTWRMVPGPTGFGPVADVWGSGPADVWAVGRGAIARWDGRAWSFAIGSPWWKLAKIWATGPDDVWAVGDGGLVLHRAGARWASALSPTSDPLAAVFGTAPDDVWIAGSAVWHWDGKRWEMSRLDPPVLALWGLGRNDVWAVGKKVLHWDGERWTTIGKIDGHLRAVWGSGPHDVWAVGSEEPLDPGDPADEPPQAGIVWRWDGTRATTTKLGARLNAIWGSGPDDVHAAGEDGQINHWNGRAWEVVKAPFAPIRDLWGRGRTEVWAVGPEGRLARWDGKEWHAQLVPRSDLMSVTGTRARVWVSGASFILGRDLPTSAAPEGKRTR